MKVRVKTFDELKDEGYTQKLDGSLNKITFNNGYHLSDSVDKHLPPDRIIELDPDNVFIDRTPGSEEYNVYKYDFTSGSSRSCYYFTDDSLVHLNTSKNIRTLLKGDKDG